MIDITIDFETCSLSPTAAIMSVGAVAWKRYSEDSPFFEQGDGLLRYPTFRPENRRMVVESERGSKTGFAR